MKPRPGDILAGLAGLLLIAALWWDWYEAGGATASAWEAFSLTDLLLALAGIGGLAVLVSQGASRVPAVPVAVAVIALALSALTLLLMLYRLLNPPGPNDLVGLEAGAYAGLLFSALLFYGIGKSLRDESARAATRPIPIDERPVPPATAAQAPDAAPDSPPPPPAADAPRGPHPTESTIFRFFDERKPDSDEPEAPTEEPGPRAS